MDPEANKRNSETPSPGMAMENQLVYKIASLESALSNSLRRLDEKLDRMQTELHDRHVESAQELSRFASSVESRLTLKRARMDALERELHDIRNTITVSSIKAVGDAKALVDQKFETLCTKIDKVEEWQTKTTIRGSMLAGGIVVAWTLFGRAIQDWLAVTF